MPPKSNLTDQQKAAKKAERDKANRERFTTLAPKRVNAALKSISLVGNCANTGGYLYSEEEAAKIITALKDAVTQVEGQFSSTKAETDKFTL